MESSSDDGNGSASIQSDLLTDEEFQFTTDGIKSIMQKKLHESAQTISGLKRSGESKGDPRTLYAKILEQGFNSLDPVLMRDIFETLLAPECTIDSSRLQADTGKEELESTVRGKEDVIEYFLGYIVAIPDLVFLVHEWRVFPRPNKQSCLVTKYSLSGTKIYDVRTSCSDPCAEERTVQSSQHRNKNRQNHSVLFREICLVSKFDSRKRRRVSTVGQFIESNRLSPDNLPSLPSLSSFLADGESQKCETDSADDTSCDSDSLLAEMRLLPQVHLLPEATNLNIVGLMRFTINEEGRITRILCTHIYE